MTRWFLLLVAVASVAEAHFPWIDTTDEAHVRVFFGEGLADRDYHLPESVAAAEVWQGGIDAPAKRVLLEPLQEEGFEGLESEDAYEPRGVFRAAVEYGVYHGSKLSYFAQHFPSEDPALWPRSIEPGQPFHATLAVEGDRLRATLILDGRPLADAEVSLTHEDGTTPRRSVSGPDGVAGFDVAALRDGLHGLVVMHVDRAASGEVEGTKFTSTTRILTATFNYRDVPRAASALPNLPEAVSSFGAAVCDGWLYVYGGHIGQAHDHSRDNLSKGFRRIRLDGSGTWEELPPGPALQGLALVAHRARLYRVGGLDARNAAGAEADLRSVATAAIYDPGAETWTDLPPLPGPRSSHNAVVVDGALYVVGGWALNGEDEGGWQVGALALDLDRPDAAWRKLPEPPFKRRALGLSHVGGKVVALCGMSDSRELSNEVYFFDPVAGVWSDGPDFPGESFAGFGLAAVNVGGRLLAGGAEGKLYRLDEASTAWEPVARFATKRFFHQLVPDGAGGVFAVAGATQDAGHTPTIERLKPGRGERDGQAP